MKLYGHLNIDELIFIYKSSGGIINFRHMTKEQEHFMRHVYAAPNIFYSASKAAIWDVTWICNFTNEKQPKTFKDTLRIVNGFIAVFYYQDCSEQNYDVIKRPHTG